MPRATPVRAQPAHAAAAAAAVAMPFEQVPGPASLPEAQRRDVAPAAAAAAAGDDDESQEEGGPCGCHSQQQRVRPREGGRGNRPCAACPTQHGLVRLEKRTRQAPPLEPPSTRLRPWSVQLLSGRDTAPRGERFCRERRPPWLAGAWSAPLASALPLPPRRDPSAP